MSLLDKLLRINAAYDAHYRGVDPFRIATRLAEECGELAAEVNHFEGVGSKRQKRGAPDRTALAGEVIDVMRCALQVASYYDALPQVEAEAERVVKLLEQRGWLPAEAGPGDENRTT